MKLSDKLIELRKQNNWSQEEFAEKLDISRQAVSRWEKETALPDAQNILRISKLFHVTADYLLNDDYENEGDIPTATTTEGAAPLVQKKKPRHLIYAIGSAILLSAVCAIIGAVIGKNAAAVHVHDGLSSVKENVVAPTCTSEGSYDEVVYCATCNEEVLRTHRNTEMLAHTPSNSVKKDEIAPTCTAKGSYYEVICCSVCREEIVRTHRTTEMLAHQFQNKKCIACGEAQPSEGLLFMSNGDGTCAVGIGNCTDEHIVIPSYSPQGEKVVQIKAYAFMVCRGVKSIQIPETVTVIGEGAFQGCENLENVNLPSGITTIDSFTFDGCKNLKEITIPDGVTHIGMEAFADCRACESIVIPASVVNIEKFAFRSFSGGDGTILFEVYGTWEVYDSSGKWVNVVDFRDQRFDAVSYLTFIYSDCVWVRQ